MWELMMYGLEINFDSIVDALTHVVYGFASLVAFAFACQNAKIRGIVTVVVRRIISDLEAEKVEPPKTP